MDKPQSYTADDASAAVLRADDERYRAMISADLSTLAILLADDLTYTHSSALSEGKHEYLGSLTSGRFRYHQAEVGERRVRLLGDTALVDGTVLLRAEVDGTARELDVHFLAVWQRQGGIWRMLAWASTPRAATN